MVSASSLCGMLTNGGEWEGCDRGITGADMELELDMRAVRCSLVEQTLKSAGASLHFLCTIWELKAIKVTCVSGIAATTG